MEKRIKGDGGNNKRTCSASEGRTIGDISWGEEEAEGGKYENSGEFEDGHEHDYCMRKCMPG